MTSKFYCLKILRYLRTMRLEAQWNKFRLCPDAEKNLLQFLVLTKQWGHMYQEKMPSLSHIEGIVDDIVERVAQLVGTQESSPKNILSFVNQVLFEEMGYRKTKISNSLYTIEKVFRDY